MKSMSFLEKRKKRKYEKEKAKIRKKLSLHLFSVSAAEQNSPTHIKLRKNPSDDDVNEYLEHRMMLRRKWIDKFFEFHPDIDSKIAKELKEDAYEDMEAFKKSLLSQLNR
jgi:hypothetical protein